MSGEDSGDKSGNASKPTFEGTSVDLGEDLLEATREIERLAEKAGAAIFSPQGAPESAPYNIDEELQKGQIFFGERLFDDAKKVFRKILRKQPMNSEATRFLEEIQRQELQDLLGGEASRKRLGAGDNADDDADKVLQRLEKELRMGFDRLELKALPDLFENDASYDRYREKIVDAACGLPARDRLDIGIAHLEMGLYDISQTIFESVVRYDDQKHAGMYLLGLALIYGGKAIEATIRLEPLCRDLTLAEGPKTDFLYLMGLAFEHLHETRKSREFFRRVSTLNPKYRDVLEKLK